jgi:hypothetical protein
MPTTSLSLGSMEDIIARLGKGDSIGNVAEAVDVSTRTVMRCRDRVKRWAITLHYIDGNGQNTFEIEEGMDIEAVNKHLWIIGIGATKGDPKSLAARVQALRTLKDALSKKKTVQDDPAAMSVTERVELLKKYLTMDELVGIFKSYTPSERQEFLRRV